MRDHSPIVIEEFNGLWKRGNADSVPMDHFSDCNNIQFVQSGFKWRDGIDTYLPINNVKRIYTYTKQTGSALLILDGSGNFIDSDYPSSPFLTVASATDFGFVAFAGRAYITPCDGNTGLSGEVLYVYEGDGTVARAAGGAKPTDSDGALAAANSAIAGNVEAGVHVFAVVYETDTGFLTAIGPDTLPTVTADGTHKIDLSNIPTSPNSYVTKRHIVATKLVLPSFFTGDTRGYQFFFVPDGEINDNTTTSLTINFFDSELLEDASYLLDMRETIPAGAGLTTYHNRLVLWATFADPSIALVSVAGEPEAMNSVDGIITFPLDGNPITNAKEFRDVLYVTKITKTNAWTDNGDVPTSWPMTILDQGLGASLHSIGTILDSEGVNVDTLIIGGLSGIYLFDGVYQQQPMTWKIEDLWLALDKTTFNKIEVKVDSIRKRAFIVLADGTMLLADFSNGLDIKDIRWSPWTFDPNITSVTFIDGNTLVLASDGLR